jgi:hypothetical protein
LSPTENRPLRVFLMPVAYFMATRMADRYAVISWIMIYPVPVLLSAYLFGDVSTPASWFAVVLAMIAMYAVYELGYMDNDARTVKIEREPTERLSTQDKAVYEKWRKAIIALRTVFVAGVVVGISQLIPLNVAGEASYVIGLFIVALVFSFYNSSRGRTNLPQHFLLVICRFTLPGMVVVSTGLLQYWVVMLLAFPVINLLERGGEARYRIGLLQPVNRYRNQARVGYYLLCGLVAFVGWTAHLVRVEVVWMFAYFLAYRSAAPLAAFALRRR